jgi:predicted enzyme related to lactoylglutathione lyase
MGKKVVHIEIPARDADRAQKFWEAVGGWSIGDSGMPGIDYRMYQEGDQGGAIFPGDGALLVYYGSEDIEADLGTVREAGGDAEDKQPIPGVGWFTRCKDTEGNPFALFQSDESVTMPEGAPGA